MTSSSNAVSRCGPPTPGEIDGSLRLVAICLASKSAFWLVAGALFSLIASVKLHGPGMMSGKAWLTYGRLLPAGWDMLVYGFAGQAGFGIGLWLLARTCGQRLQAPLLALAGLAVWNLAVLVGVVGILSGASTGLELLEMPFGATAGLVVGGGLIGATGWATYAARTESSAYPSAWFVLLALLSFVWFGTAALMLLPGADSRGVLQVLVQRWFAGGIVKLWLGGLALAVLFDALPKLVDRPLASRSLALWTFWCLVCFTPWAITAHGDPFPRWVISVGLAGKYLGMMGVLAAGLNWWKTVEGSLDRVWATGVGRLVGASAASFLLVGALGFLASLQSVSGLLRLTWFEQGMDWLMLGGTVTLAFVAVLPGFLAAATGHRLSARLVHWHGAFSLAGVLLTALPLILAGFAQGTSWEGKTAGFMDSLTASMRFVRLSSLGLVLFLAGQVIWCVAVADWMKGLATEVLDVVRGWAAPLIGKGAGAR